MLPKPTSPNGQHPRTAQRDRRFAIARASRPATAPDERIVLNQPAVASQNQRHRVVGDLFDEGIRDVGEQDAVAGDRINVDVVVADVWA